MHCCKNSNFKLNSIDFYGGCMVMNRVCCMNRSSFKTLCLNNSINENSYLNVYVHFQSVHLFLTQNNLNAHQC